MYSAYRVMVSYEAHSLYFQFIRMADAIEFASTCLECGDEGTTVLIKGIKEA